jgi:hypothetical protein
MSANNLNELRRIVFSDAVLQRELQGIPERERFVERVMQIGEERGLFVTEEEIRETMRGNHRLWIERWI